MVNVKEYNQRDKESLEEIAKLEAENKTIDKKHNLNPPFGSKDGRRQEKIWERIRELNPLLRKEDPKPYQGSIFDRHSGYKRKLPITSLDGKIITVLEQYLENWRFLQQRTGHGQNIYIFEHQGDIDYDKMRSYLKEEEFNCYHYSKRFLSDLGFDKAIEKLNDLLKSDYKIKQVEACADIDWPAQGEMPGANHEYLCLSFRFENKKNMIQQLDGAVRKAERNLEKAKRRRKNYR